MQSLSEGISVGRPALRRSWQTLRDLAAKHSPQLDDSEIQRLLGKAYDDLDPEKNDLKALVAYAIGKGLGDPEELLEALASDVTSEPMAFLAQLSGKSFGETWAPRIAQFWLCADGDGWSKKRPTNYYDIDFAPTERPGQEVRIEVKASSEHPEFRFQQIRHPQLSGEESAYDLLLCLGVTAGSLEWWAIPTARLDDFADNGATPEGRIIITKHHGNRAPIWNADAGYADEGWFCANEKARRVLAEYHTTSEPLRQRVMKLLGIG